MIRHPRLTIQQQRVMELAAAGLTGKEIADRLDIGVSAVDRHRQHAKERLGAHTPHHAAILFAEWRSATKRRPRHHVPVQDTTLELV